MDYSTQLTRGPDYRFRSLHRLMLINVSAGLLKIGQYHPRTHIFGLSGVYIPSPSLHQDLPFRTKYRYANLCEST